MPAARHCALHTDCCDAKLGDLRRRTIKRPAPAAEAGASAHETDDLLRRRYRAVAPQPLRGHRALRRNCPLLLSVASLNQVAEKDGDRRFPGLPVRGRCAGIVIDNAGQHYGRVRRWPQKGRRAFLKAIAVLKNQNT